VTVVSTADAPGRLRAALRGSDGLGRLGASRLLALLSEGIHQAALGGVVLFSPETAGSPGAIVAGFAVMLLPYSLVGPFAAAALDRWDRRFVIAVACVVRVLAIVVTALLVAAGAAASASGTGVLLALSLVAIGLGRLVNTGMTAAMPHVVPSRLLAAANSVLVTAGSVLTAVGGVVAFAVLAVLGASGPAVAWTLLPAVLSGLAGAWTVLALPRGHLGPDTGERRRPAGDERAWATAGAGLVEGVRAARHAPLVGVCLTAITLARAAFGATTLVAVLLLRRAEESGASPTVAGMGGFGLLTGLMAAGMGMAAVVTPWAIARHPRAVVVAAGAVVAGVAQLLVGPTLDPVLLVAGAAVLGLGGQVVKLVGDNAMQTDVPDTRRGAVFALQDALFNSAFVAGAALVSPWAGSDGGWVLAMTAAGVTYLAAALPALVLWAGERRGSGPRREGASGHADAPGADTSTTHTADTD